MLISVGVLLILRLWEGQGNPGPGRPEHITSHWPQDMYYSRYKRRQCSRWLVDSGAKLSQAELKPHRRPSPFRWCFRPRGRALLFGRHATRRKEAICHAAPARRFWILSLNNLEESSLFAIADCMQLAMAAPAPISQTTNDHTTPIPPLVLLSITKRRRHLHQL